MTQQDPPSGSAQPGLDIASLAPGAIIPGEGELIGLAERPMLDLEVSNTGDRPIQVGSHFHFFESNRALRFERSRAWGMRLAIAAGTAVRFEPGLTYVVTLVAMGGERVVFGGSGLCSGSLDAPGARERALREAAERGFKGA